MVKIQCLPHCALLIITLAGCATAAGPGVSEKSPEKVGVYALAQAEQPGPVSQRGDGISYPPTRKTLLEAGIAPEKLRCNTKVIWARNLKGYADNMVDEIARIWGVTPARPQLKQAQHQALGYLVRSFFEEANMHNLGVMRLKGHSYQDAQGRQRPLLVFRSGLIVAAEPASACVQSLLEQGQVRHVINLYAGSFPFRDLIEQEKLLVHRHGATYHDDGDPGQRKVCWRKLVEDEPDYGSNSARAQQLLARLIREQVLRPGGQPPRGNIYLHCGGGMHRSGMIFGVMRRCINGAPFEEIRAEYARHVGWLSDEQPGGFEELNLRFIKEFDCSLISLPQTAASASPQIGALVP